MDQFFSHIFLKRFLTTNTGLHERMILQDSDRIDKIVRFMKEIGIILPIDDDDRLASRCSKQGSIFHLF